jgi:hypothetical protein
MATVQGYQPLGALIVCAEECLSPYIKTNFLLYLVHMTLWEAILCYQVGVGLRSVLNELPGLMRPFVVWMTSLV